ncbi:MAG: serine hydrolase [Planctomycetes bacterium]|nr:serine hydrolase [Planctomycetota bacterium]
MHTLPTSRGGTIGRNFIQRVLRTAAVALAALIAAPAIADSGRDSTVPTGWFWYHSQPASVLDNLVNNSNQRPVCLTRSPDDTTKYDFATVTNSGAYSQGFWYYYNVNATQVANLLNTNHARLLSLDAYVSGANTLFNVVMVDNTGANSKGWWWYYGASSAQLVTAASTNNARPIFLRQYTSGGNTVYACVMIARTGADNLGWGWHFGASSSTINSYINSNNVRIIDLQQTGANTFNAVYEQGQGQRWYWRFGRTDTQMNDDIGNLGCRVYACQSFGGVYAALLMQNGNAETERIGGLMRDTGMVGNLGCYLKEVNGPILVDLNSTRVFEPASGIKLPIHLHAMRQVYLNNTTLGSTNTVYSGYNGSCPVDTGPFTEALSTSLRRMMENSDNARTQAMRVRFNDSNIMSTAVAAGATNTVLVANRVGCTTCDPNLLMHFTLRDAGAMYEAVSNGFLGADGPGSVRSTFYDLMYDTNNVGIWVFGNVVDQEAAAAGMTASEKAQFKNLIYFAAKGGDYGFGCVPPLTPGGEFHSGTAWWKIPFKENDCTITMKEYVSGGFTDHCDSIGGTVRSIYEPELTRGPVRAAIATWVANHHGNETCATATTLPGEGTYAFDTTGACTDGPAEPGCSFCCGDTQINQDVWFRISAPPAGTITVDTFGSLFDTKLGVYRGCPSGSGQVLACNDDFTGHGTQSQVSFNSDGASTYIIRVGGYRTAEGQGLVTISYPLPCPADFNQDGGIDGADVQAFFAAWERGDSSADVNQDGGVDGADVSTFFAAWEAGGCN